MKKLLITVAICIPLQSCIALAVAGGTVAVYKGSQAANAVSGGKKHETLTEASYQACKNEKKRCFEKNLYTAMFFPVDTVYTTITGRPDLIGSSHGKIWHEIDKKIPNLPTKKDSK